MARGSNLSSARRLQPGRRAGCDPSRDRRHQPGRAGRRDGADGADGEQHRPTTARRGARARDRPGAPDEPRQAANAAAGEQLRPASRSVCTSIPPPITYVLIDIEGSVRSYARRRTQDTGRPDQVVAGIAAEVQRMIDGVRGRPVARARPRRCRPRSGRRGGGCVDQPAPARTAGNGSEFAPTSTERRACMSCWTRM